MFAKGRRGNLVFSDLIFSQLVLSLLLFSHPFIALGAGGRGFIPNQPKRYYDAFVKVHFIRGIFTFSLHQKVQYSGLSQLRVNMTNTSACRQSFL